jgi:hypothetical protein
LEGTPLKALYALAFVLVSFAAPAQTLETWIAAYHLDDLDCLGEVPPQIIGVEVFCPPMFNGADGVATTEPNGADDAGAIQPSDEGSTVKHSTGSDDTLTENETIKQGAIPTQIIAPERTIEKLEESGEPEGVAKIGPNDAEDVPVETIQASDQISTINYLTGRDDKQAVDDTAEQDATPTQIIATQPTVDTVGEAKLNEADDVAISGPNGAENVPVGAIQVRDAAILSRSDDQSTAEDTIE